MNIHADVYVRSSAGMGLLLFVLLLLQLRFRDKPLNYIYK